MRERKPETIMAEQRRSIRLLEAKAKEMDYWRARAKAAEVEIAEWKTRFDALLARTPEVKP